MRQEGLSFISLLVGLAVAVVVGVVSYFVFYPSITGFGSNFLNNFLNTISQRQTAPGGLPYTQPSTRRSTPTPTQREKIVVFENLEEAMESGLGLRCEFTSAGAQHTTYVKDGKARTDSSAVGETGAMGIIVRDYSMWMWFKDSKEGFMTTYTEEDFDRMMGGGGDETPSDFRCWEEVIDDALLMPPSDITFYDAGGFTQ